jgi:Phytanoyl-CoA dioxygenase (PhyH)
MPDITRPDSAGSPTYLDAAFRQSTGEQDTSAGEKLAELFEDGFTLIDLGPEALDLCDQVSHEAEALSQGLRIGRIQDGWRRSQAARRLATHPKILAFLRTAYGREPFAFQTLNFKTGSEQAPHADSFHFNAEPEGFMCGVWVALEDILPDSGPLIYYPGSQKISDLHYSNIINICDEQNIGEIGSGYVSILGDLLKKLGIKSKTALIKKGQAFIWTSNLVHGGSAIRDQNLTRKSLVTHYYFRDCFYFTPINSLLKDGLLHARLPQDIKSGRFVVPRRNGKPVWPGLRTLGGAIMMRVLRKVAVQ